MPSQDTLFLVCLGGGWGGISESQTYCDAGTCSNASRFDGDRQTEIPGGKGAGEKVGWVKQHLQR